MQKQIYSICTCYDFLWLRMRGEVVRGEKKGLKRLLRGDDDGKNKDLRNIPVSMLNLS